VSEQPPILVAGGGIGGLTCALALAKRGIASRVLEQAPEFGEIGAGIQLGPNMVRALAVLGLKERVLSDAWFPDTLAVRDALDGAELTEIPVGDGFLARFGEPYALTHRGDLLAAMLEACRDEALIELLPGRRVESIADRGDHVTAKLRSGETLQGGALVGADGVWSAIRSEIVGDGRPRVAGHVAYRAVLPADEVPEDAWSPDMTVWFGPGTHLVHYPLRRGELFNLVAVFHSDRYVEGWDHAGDVEELRRRFSRQQPQVQRLLAKIDGWRYWILCDREPQRGWSRGRLTVLGDAAHPMLQYLAQGAAMAVEDSVCLACALDELADDVPAALSVYERRRVLRTGRAQIMARVYGDVFHAAGVAAELRNQWLAGRSEQQSWEGMAWLYDFRPGEE
jgi:3-hydroxybenzoate 6-monooxygenase